MSKFTLGPWRVQGSNIVANWEDGEEVSLCIMEHTRWCGKDVNGQQAKRINRETPANAALIAAAPELYEACKALFGHIESGTLVRSIEKDGDSDWTVRMFNFARDLANTRTALFKAEGKA